MKNKPQYIAVSALAILEAYNIFRSFNYYKDLFTRFSLSYYGGIYAIQEIFSTLFLLFEIVLIMIFFATEGRYQDKVYKLLRYTFLMSLFLYFPYTLYYYITSGKQFFSDSQPALILMQMISTIAALVCAFLLLRTKPQSQPAKIDLADYELVNYTSTGHRFVHYLLDMLFLIPIFFFWGRILRVNNEYVLELLLIVIYLVYCCASEILFRQTFGKIATNSVVTTIGYELNFGRILLRTLARLIPFDKISFLFRANWHDKTTSTSVVYADSWEKVFEEPAPMEAPAITK